MADQQSNADQENDDQDIDIQDLADQGQEQEDNQEKALQLSSMEQKAFDQGWRPEDEFNGPSENWKTAKEYVRDGEWMTQMNDLKGQISSQQKSFDHRIENLNKLNKAQTEAKIKSLKSQQREAVLTSDADAHDQLQGEIEELQAKPETEDKPADQPGKDPAIVAWEAKNSWFNDMSDERGEVAVGVWNSYINKNPTASVAQTLAHIDERIERLYPSNIDNPRRNQKNTIENNTRRSARKSKGLTMGDLTNDEREQYGHIGHMFKNEAEFLQTVADTRVT